MNRLAMIFVFASCSWSQFDDLSNSTPVHAQEKPDPIKAADYGVAIVGATTPTETSGGRLAVLSTGNGNYSTLDFDATGKTTLGDSETLTSHTIDAVSGNALFITDGAGNVAIIDNSSVSSIVVVHGVATSLSADQQIPTPQKPDAATFAGTRIVVAAGPVTLGGPNLFSVKDGAVNPCTATDNVGALSVVALAADATHLWVWSKTGVFYSYTLTALDATPCVLAAPIPSMTATVGQAPNGGHIDIDPAGGFAVLTTFDTPTTTMGQVAAVNLTTMAVSAPVSAHGVRAATLASFDGQSAVVLGYPTRPVGGTANGGAIDIHLFDSTLGQVTATPEQSLMDSQATANLTLGRAVTTMLYNGKPIIVASASNVVYAYYATQLYTKR